jgi:hypothetical protein
MRNGNVGFAWLQKGKQITFHKLAKQSGRLGRLLIERPGGVVEINEKESSIAGSSQHISAMQVVIREGKKKKRCVKL